MAQSFKLTAAQGDIRITRISDDEYAEGIKDGTKTSGGNEQCIVTHSETGHHHVIERGAVQTETNNPLVAYLEVQMEMVDLIHNRSYDTHEALKIPQGKYIIRRQREATPEGFRQVQD